MELEPVNSYLSTLAEMIIQYAPKLLLAGLVLFIGWQIIHRLASLTEKSMQRAKVSDNIRPFLSSLLSVSLKVLLIFSAASIIGIETSSFLAVLAAAGFAVGLALQGSLSNFASGILVLLFRPYKVGDWIEVEERFGKVEEIQIFNTIIITPGQKTLIIPNSKITEGMVTNFSKKGHIRIELAVSMPYDESFPKVRDIIMKELNSIPKVLDTPAPEVGIETYDSHNIVLAVRPYVLPDDYWEVTFEAYSRIKAAFHANNIRVAYSEGVEMGQIGV